MFKRFKMADFLLWKHMQNFYILKKICLIINIRHIDVLDEMNTSWIKIDNIENPLITVAFLLSLLFEFIKISRTIFIMDHWRNNLQICTVNMNNRKWKKICAGIQFIYVIDQNVLNEKQIIHNSPLMLESNFHKNEYKSRLWLYSW